MSVKQFFLLFFFVLLAVFEANSLELFLYNGTEGGAGEDREERIVQGDPLAFLIQPGSDIIAVKSECLDKEGNTCLSASGFPLDDFLGLDAWLVYLGIPSNFDEGTYSFRFHVYTHHGDLVLEREVEIAGKTFKREDIPLSSSMTELRSKPDPRKAEEARELLALLNRHDPHAKYWSGNFILPTKPRRTSSFFGDRRTYLYSDGNRAYAIHNGIDLAADRGTAVRAAGGGKVLMAKDRIITGKTVVIEHLPAFYSLYYHLDEITVKKGDFLERAVKIGTVGDTGLVTGPHLHWEVRVAGVAVDPGFFIENGLVDKRKIVDIINRKPVRGYVP